MYVCLCVRACMCVSNETGLGQSVHPGQRGPGYMDHSLA